MLRPHLSFRLIAEAGARGAVSFGAVCVLVPLLLQGAVRAATGNLRSPHLLYPMPYEGLSSFAALLLVGWLILLPLEGLLLRAAGWRTTAADRLHASAFALAPFLLSLFPLVTLLAIVLAHGYRAYAYRTALRLPWPEALLGALTFPILLVAAFIRYASSAPG